jgi:hypothetical protein
MLPSVYWDNANVEGVLEGLTTCHDSIHKWLDPSQHHPPGTEWSDESGPVICAQLYISSICETTVNIHVRLRKSPVLTFLCYGRYWSRWSKRRMRT